MARILKPYHVLFGFLPQFGLTADIVKETKTSKSLSADELKDTEPGMDRVKRIFKIDEFGNISSELNVIANTTCMSMFVGAMYGGFMGSKVAYLDFMKNNQATVFRDHLEAKKRLQDKVTLSFGKGAFKWGWRLTLFTTSYVTMSTVIASYRGKNGVLEHAVAGAFTGFLYKFQTGPQASIVGGGLGLVLGTLAGLCTSGLLKLTGMNMDEIKYWQYKWRESRMDLKRQAIEQYVKREQVTLLDSHEKSINESEET